MSSNAQVGHNTLVGLPGVLLLTYLDNGAWENRRQPSLLKPENNQLIGQ